MGEPFSDDVCIPGGEFLMGHDPIEIIQTPCVDETPDDGNNDCGPGMPSPSDFTPVHLVRLSPFFIDRNPVTNGQYLECFEAGMCPDECTALRTCDGPLVRHVSFHDPAVADYPMAGTTFEGAEAYCRWAGKRLPTEAEWERAARGRLSFDYPWGNGSADCTHVPCGPPPFDWDHYYFRAVTEPTGDISPEGIRGLVTSAREFVSDFYHNLYYQVSPVEDPRGPRFAPHHGVRGNLSQGDSRYTLYLWFNSTSFPMPAWARTSYTIAVGGMRCARDDDGVGSSQQALIRVRQNIQRGPVWSRRAN